MIKNTFIVAALVAAILVTSAPSAFAITSAQRVAILKYQKCLSNFLVVDKTLCHL